MPFGARRQRLGSDPCRLGRGAKGWGQTLAVMGVALGAGGSAGGLVRTSGIMGRMDTAAAIFVGVFLLLTILLVLALFVWAAKKDGEKDEAVQRRLGIRRKTRLGR